MAWQKGPGEGYNAAKADALRINPRLRCRAIYYQRVEGDPRKLVGFVVEDEAGKPVGRGLLSRDAWGQAFLKLGGRYVCGVAVFPKARRRGK